jgi:collagenase-like PrtC family protease
MKQIRRCQYENCGKVLTNRRPNVKFCCDNCRKHYATYLKRDNDRFKNEKKIYKDLLEEAKLLQNQDLLDLYKLIYK